MNPEGELTIAKILIIPLVIGLIQAFKRFVPNAPANVYLALSLILSTGLYIGHTWVQTPFPWLPGTWEETLIGGLAFGLASSKAWDEAVKPVVERV